MKLFHNADIKDINHIVEQGLLPMSVTGNDRWNSGKRADNSKDVVYLFNPIGLQNSFTHYGLALIEVEVDGALKSDIVVGDVNAGGYEEYTISSVAPSQIKQIYIPAIFRHRLNEQLSSTALEKVEWVVMSAEIFSDYIPNPDNPYGYGGTCIYKTASAEFLKEFADVAPVSVDDFNYFRAFIGGEMVDLYGIRYASKSHTKNHIASQVNSKDNSCEDRKVTNNLEQNYDCSTDYEMDEEEFEP